jgi:SAM-dependent methyltransferase
MIEELPTSAPAERNKDPILAILSAALRDTSLQVRSVLEIASGFGQHVVHFAAALPDIAWQPSDPDAASREVIAQRVHQSGLSNISLPVELDVLADWPNLQVDAVVVANLLHISPIATVEGLFAGAGQVCRDGGLLHLYGPFKQGGAHTSTGNAEFDKSLKQRNPQWGIRDVEAVIEQAQDLDWELLAQKDMPANNLSLLFRLKTS